MKKSDTYMYLHCDEWSSIESMNPCQDNIIYCGRAGRRTLWHTIMNDIADDIIEVNTDPETMKNIILYGNPTEANDGITYAYIVRLEEAK